MRVVVHFDPVRAILDAMLPAVRLLLDCTHSDLPDVCYIVFQGPEAAGGTDYCEHQVSFAVLVDDHTPQPCTLSPFHHHPLLSDLRC